MENKKKHSKVLKSTYALSAAAILALNMTGCNSSSEPDDAQNELTVTSPSVAINTEQLNEEDKEAVNNVSSSLLIDKPLENKEIKWLAHYDLNPDGRGGSKSLELEMFESTYGGNIKYYPTTWENRWSDLSVNLLGGEGIDFFPFETSSLPKGIVSGMFEPIDEYIDVNSPIWQETAQGMEIFNFNGSHYEFCTGVSPEAVVIYNKQTIDEFGFDDPWELYQNGSWNWETFKRMMYDFVDVDNGMYGLDGWYYQKALATSAGGSIVTLSDNGLMELTVDDPRFGTTLDFARELYSNNMFMDMSMFDWKDQPQKMGEGTELFYFCGVWTFELDPSLWTTAIEPENVGMVPVPCSPDYDAVYSIIPNGFTLCKGASNPEGVARFAECCIAASISEDTIRITNEKRKKDFGWTDSMIEQYNECVRAAKENPYYDFSFGISDDFYSAIPNTVINGSFNGEDPASLKDMVRDVGNLLVDEFNGELSKAIS